MSKLPGANLEFVREDDFVEYYIFPKLAQQKNSSEEELRQQLEQVRKDCMEIVEKKVKERSYIWHKDQFQLQLRTGSAEERLLNEEDNHEDEGEEEQEATLPPHLHGVTHYGDNIGDEWFIVYLLSELTAARADWIARVCDADGEFLLIEAADVLPDWASPETCEQRVYIMNGQLQLIQNSTNSSQQKRLSMATAVHRIHLNPTLYRCSQDIQNCIDARCREFHAAKQHAAIHRQIVQLPQNAAQLLKQRPALVASAVRAFCERDSLDTKALRSMRYFPPESPRIRTNVAFTRCLYAMLMHSQYTPERRLGWKLTDAVAQPEIYKEQLLGVKLASGLEILASQAKQSSEELEEQSPAWRAYLRSLQKKGYFRDNLEGSAEYVRLLNTAKQYFKGNQQRFRTAPLVGAEIVELLLHTGEGNAAEQLRDEENNLLPSDADDWLNISAEELDAMLQQRYGPQKLYNPNGDVNAAEFTKQLSQFLDRQSNFEGIETKEEAAAAELDSDDDEPAEPASAASTSCSSSNSRVKKNPSMRKACQQRNSLIQSEEQDSTHVRNFLDFVIPEDNWDSNSEMSDYADEDDIERNFDALSSASGMGPDSYRLDRNIKAYMEQMDRELSQTTIGKSFQASGNANANVNSSQRSANEDDFDDIEDFEPININVNTLRNMMDSYKSQMGGAGPVSNLFTAMGVGMSAAAASEKKDEELSESAV
ncbi:hypothetical protein KR215_007357 [Drosophila sulfurigaster]|nr:hypothetical protein KR215_007357 [Drosophila sulfurigaster]